MESLFKALHIFGAFLFTGNTIISVLWKAWAKSSGHTEAQSFVEKQLRWIDGPLTGIGILLLVLGGIGTAIPQMSELLSWNWFRWCLGLSSVSLIFWFLALNRVRTGRSSYQVVIIGLNAVVFILMLLKP